MDAQDRAAILSAVRDALDAQGGPFGGFAFVAWAPDMSNNSTFGNFRRSPLSRMMIPEFVAGQLRLAVLEDNLVNG